MVEVVGRVMIILVWLITPPPRKQPAISPENRPKPKENVKRLRFHPDFLRFSAGKYQLMVNWWFGLVVWDSGDTPK